MNQPTLRLAETAEDREKLYRFRYEIYVEEMGLGSMAGAMTAGEPQEHSAV